MKTNHNDTWMWVMFAAVLLALLINACSASQGPKLYDTIECRSDLSAMLEIEHDELQVDICKLDDGWVGEIYFLNGEKVTKPHETAWEAYLEASIMVNDIQE